MGAMFNGLLFFPVTPYRGDGYVDLDELAAHVVRGVDAGAGGVFVACGTGEFSALEPEEYAEVVRVAVTAIGGRVPVFAGAGGPGRTARRVSGPALGAAAPALADYGRAPTREALPVIVYNRANARFDEVSAVAVARLPQVIGFKDGAGDLDLMIRIVRAVRDAARDGEGGHSFFFFNGMPTAEVTQRAYRAIGVPLYSSAAFAFAPQVALAYYRALEHDEVAVLDALERSFYHPLARLRAKGTGYAVSLIKAGVELAGDPTGGVRPPLTAVAQEHLDELARILAAGLTAIP